MLGMVYNRELKERNVIQLPIAVVILGLAIRDDIKRRRLLRKIMKEQVAGKITETTRFELDKKTTVTVTPLKSATGKRWQVEFKSGNSSWLYLYDELNDSIKAD